MNFRVSIFKKGNNDKKSEINEEFGIILTADEIVGVEYNIDTDKKLKYLGKERSLANTRGELELKITGKLIAGLKEENEMESNLGFKTMHDNFQSGNVIEEGLKDLSKEIKNKFKALNDEMFGDIKALGEDDFYENNKKNIIELTKWSFGYKKDEDYRDILLEVDLGSGKMLTVLFENMYAVSCNQRFSIEDGSGYVTLGLKQKYYDVKEIEMK